MNANGTADADTRRRARKAGPNPAILAVDIAKRLRNALDWQKEIDAVLSEMGMALRGHRMILFKLMEMPGDRGLSQSIRAFWVDKRLEGIRAEPAIIPQSLVNNDDLLGRLAEEVRRGQSFIGHTRDLTGFLRAEFQGQSIRSFCSVPVIAHGRVWGTLAVNDCVREREWLDHEVAALEIVALSIGHAIERSESDAHVSEVIYSAMLEASLDAVVTVDETGSIVEFNPAAEKLYGWRRQDILGKDALDTIIPEFYRGGYATGGEYLVGRGAPMVGRRIETLSQTVSGDIIPIELTVIEVKVADRRLYLGSVRDLREKRRAEDEINSQREKLHQNEKMAAMGSLLAGVSHELNNPLAVVVAQSTLLHEFAPDQPTKTRAEKVRAAAERCGRIVKSFLGMVRLHPANETATDLTQVARAALEVTAYGARSSGIVVESRFAEGSVLVSGDADHLTQVAANFLVNAQHALMGTPDERRIVISTFRKSGGINGFSIEDNGAGIPEAIRHRIFESYFTTKPAGVGTGIGLSISKSIVERHKGHTYFEPVFPTGARFVVELPAIARDSVRHVEPSLGETTLRRALIVDDEPDVAASLADILGLMGLRPTVETTWQGRDNLMDIDADIIFSDLRMPGISTIELYRQLLALRPDLAARFVIVTGDMIGARADIDQLPVRQRPQLLEKPFSTLDVRGALFAIAEQVSAQFAAPT
jgi:PAS domain S-box-containing protein